MDESPPQAKRNFLAHLLISAADSPFPFALLRAIAGDLSASNEPRKDAQSDALPSLTLPAPKPPLAAASALAHIPLRPAWPLPSTFDMPPTSSAESDSEAHSLLDSWQSSTANAPLETSCYTSRHSEPLSTKHLVSPLLVRICSARAPPICAARNSLAGSSRRQQSPKTALAQASKLPCSTPSFIKTPFCLTICGIPPALPRQSNSSKIKKRRKAVSDPCRELTSPIESFNQ